MNDEITQHTFPESVTEGATLWVEIDIDIPEAKTTRQIPMALEVTTLPTGHQQVTMQPCTLGEGVTLVPGQVLIPKEEA